MKLYHSGTLKRLLLLFLSVLFSNNIFAQLTDSLKKGPVLNQSFRSLQTGVAFSRSVFRDFATSPLFYFGNIPQFSLAWAKEESQRDSRLLLKYQTGTYKPSEKELKTPATVKTIYLQYSNLWYLGTWQNTDVRLGGMVDLSGNFRVNTALQNNASGMEFMNTFFLSARIGRDLSRKEVKYGKICWLIPYKWLPRKRSLSFQLNAAVMNNSLRNGYIYSNQANITNKPNPLYNYRFNAFSGYRLNSALEYSVFLGNGNAVRYGWYWDAFQSGEKYNRFEMGHNAFELALLFQVPVREKR